MSSLFAIENNSPSIAKNTALQAMDSKLDINIFNTEAEQDVIASLLLDNQNIDLISAVLQGNNFYYNIHRKIYSVVSGIISKGGVADVMNITHALEADEDFIRSDGKNYLNNILLRTTNIIPVRERVKIVHDLAIRRQLLSLADKIRDESKISTNCDKLAEEIENSVFKMRSDAISQGGAMQKIGYFFQGIIDTTDKARRGNVLAGVPTGFADLDDLLSGMNPSDLIILAARPSMGKTALAINIAYNVAVHAQNSSDGGVAFFSLEMSSEQISTRILSMISGVSSVAIRTGKYSKYDKEQEQKGLAGHKITEQDFAKLQDIAGALQATPMFIDDTPAISTSMLRTRARMLKKMYNISLIVVDYLQLMRATDAMGSNNRVLEISEITQTLKAIAKELKIPVIALSQLSRQVEARDDKHPQLADLRESGSIEQDADVVMFIYRDEYYLEKSKPQPPRDPSDSQAKDTKEWQVWHDRMHGRPLKNSDGTFVISEYTGEPKLIGGAQNIAEIIIAKHRNGPVGSVRLFFDKSRTLFDNLSD